jgi:hypothetical protein
MSATTTRLQFSHETSGVPTENERNKKETQKQAAQTTMLIV